MFRRAPFCEARETLLQAARDGRLASAFKEMRKASLQFGLVLGVTWCDYDNLIDFSCLQDRANTMLFGLGFVMFCMAYGFCRV